MSSKILAIIPARGGSKGVPGKNIRVVAGKPLIAWTVEAALNASGVDRVIVTTDDPKIAGIAKAYRAETPFLRPEALARDDTPSIEAVLHAIHWLAQNQKYQPDYVLLLQPTSPLRTAKDIELAIETLHTTNSEATVSITPIKHHPYLTMRLTDHGKLENFFSEDLLLRRQDLPSVYALNGALYLTKREIILQHHSFYAPNNTAGYVMPRNALLILTPSGISK